MTRAAASGIHQRRVERVLGSLSALGADGAVISAAGVVSALSGIWLETGEIMPSRNPWLLAAADGSLVLLVDEVEAGLAARRCALDSAQMVTHHGSEERLHAVRSWMSQGSHRRLAADMSGISARDMRGLALADADIVDVSHLTEGVGREKSPAEIAMIRQAAAAMITAVTRTCASPDSVDAPESVVAGKIAGYIYGTGEEWYSVVPIVSSGSNLRVPHARPGSRRLGRGDLCRIGARGKFGPFHVMCVRTAAVRPDRLDLDAGELAELAAVHGRTVRALRPGASGALGPDPAEGPLRRVPVPAAQGMGFEFKEPPTLDAGSPDRLEPGDIVMVSTILQQAAGDRWYCQQMAAVGTHDVVLLET